MSLTQAKKLHIGDEVIEKSSGKIWEIIAAEWKFLEKTFLKFSCVDAAGNMRIFYHIDIK